MNLFIRLFPLWAIIGSVVAAIVPEPFAASGEAIPLLLGFVMLGMGLALTPADFKSVVRQPALVALGTVLQFAVMPAAGWLIGIGLGLEPALLTGMVLVGAAPGGTASNVIAYLAKGDVALSITLTSVSTLLAVIATPFLTWLYIGALVPVPVMGMLLTVATMIVLPVMVGLLLNTMVGEHLASIKRVFPAFSVAAIVFIIMVIVALNRDALETLGPALTAAVALHNGTGLVLGYGVARLLGTGRRAARTIAIEVGMQNSGLAVALALKHFTTATALPGALFSIWHNLSGSALAAFWGRTRAVEPVVVSR